MFCILKGGSFYLACYVNECMLVFNHSYRIPKSINLIKGLFLAQSQRFQPILLDSVVLGLWEPSTSQQ